MESMDRKQKQHILDLLYAFRTALEENFINTNFRKMVYTHLIFCDKLCHKYFSASHYAEYSELLKPLIDILLHLDWQNTANEKQNQISKLTAEIISALMEKLQKDKRDIKKEIVFLPYKASMWDCMDTVWQAAYEDKDSCNVHVVPIPYCTLTAEMQVDKWHCEENLPAYVPITHWQDMDLEKLHPDVIVIHNPYDGGNAVTSVDCRYWSTELKKYTDRLIYIPYYTASSLVSPNIIKSPGIANADYVVVDNENVKKQYERCYPVGSYAKDKFVPLGSPKIERALKTTKSDVPLPDEWAKIVGDKPVLLYNTSLGAMLRSSEYVCDKLRYVFKKYKNQRDIAFWWRPHPLMKDTLKSLRPNVYDEYCAIEKEYIQEDWGIYDDTPDMDRAITWGDCYYGDPSGVMNTYVETGKPVVEQCIGYTADNKENMDISVWGKAFCRVGDTVWLVHGKLNILLNYDIATEKLSFVTKLGQDIFVKNQYTEMDCVANKLYIIPGLGKEIICYDIGLEKLTTIDFPKQDEYEGALKFIGALCIKGKIFCIPNMYPYMLCIDGVTGNVEWFIDIEKIKRNAEILPSSYVNDTTVYKNRYLVSVICNTNRILIIDTEDRTCRLVQLGNRTYSSIAIIRERLFVGCAEEDVVCCYCMEDFSLQYIIQTNLHNVYQFDDERLIMDNANLLGWLIVDGDNQVVYSNKDGEPRDKSVMMDNNMRVINAAGQNISIDTNTNRLYIWDKKIAIKLSLRNAEHLDDAIFQGQTVCHEYPGLDIVTMLGNRKQNICTYNNVGEKIYDKLMK